MAPARHRLVQEPSFSQRRSKQYKRQLQARGLKNPGTLLWSIDENQDQLSNVATLLLLIRFRLVVAIHEFQGYLFPPKISLLLLPASRKMPFPRGLIVLALAAAAICCLPSSNALTAGGEGEQDSGVGKVALRLAREKVEEVMKGGLFKKRGSKEYEFDAEDEAGRLRRPSPPWICFCIRVRSSSCMNAHSLRRLRLANLTCSRPLELTSVYCRQLSRRQAT